MGAHRSKEVRAVFGEAGVHLKFMSPYSPERNPIELWWQWLKDRLRTRRACDHQTLDAAIDLAMEALPPMVATSWPRHCGYAVKSL